MTAATFRFHAELNDFLLAERQHTPFAYPFNPPVSIKHLIEAAGVPHTEVEVITANGISVDFSYLVQPGDEIDVYPALVPVAVSPLTPLRPPLPSPPRFILDIHLGQLATYLRLLGFDTLYPDNYDDEYLAQVAHDEARVMLTRDRGLLKRSLVVYGYCLRTRDPEAQLQAVLQRFQLHDAVRPWQCCLRCNGRLQPIAKEDILHRLQPKTKKYYHEFYICQTCDHIYWKGSHYGALKEFIDKYA